jgi:hypothetical protein
MPDESSESVFYIRLTSIADYNRISTESENGDNLLRTNETGTARSDRKQINKEEET